MMPALSATPPTAVELSRVLSQRPTTKRCKYVVNPARRPLAAENLVGLGSVSMGISTSHEDGLKRR